MKKLILRLIGVFFLVCFSIGFFYEHNFIIAVPLLFWAITLYLGYTFKAIDDTFRGFALEIKENFYTNSSLTCDVNISEVLKHPETQKIFNVLRTPSNSRITKDILREDVNFEEWQEAMLASFQQKKGEQTHIEHVHFYIRNGLLFKDNQITDSDVIIHETHISYPESIRKSEIPKYEREGSIEKDLTIQILLSNGFLRVRVGDMSPSISTFDEGFRYRNWITITSFPLIYCPQYHRIPAKFLNLNHQGVYTSNEPDPKNKWDILGSLYQDESRYKILCRFADSSENDLKKQKLLKTYKESEKDFETKLEKYCADENFKDHHAEDRARDDHFAKYAYTSGRYSNSLLTAYFVSMNDIYEYRKEDYSDFARAII